MKVTMRVRSHIAGQELAEVPSALDHRVLASVRREAAAVREKKSWFAPVWFTRISIPLPAAASIIFLTIVGSLLFAPMLISGDKPSPDVSWQQISRIAPELQRQLQWYK
jgi:hypothetical protein